MIDIRALYQRESEYDERKERESVYVRERERERERERDGRRRGMGGSVYAISTAWRRIVTNTHLSIE